MAGLIDPKFISIFLLITFCSARGVMSQGVNEKIALVIGVKSYQFVQPLKNSLKDAKDMAALLKTKGFRVMELYEPATKREMQDAIRKYFGLLNGKANATGLIYYSGHGMQVDGINYFIPASANPQMKADLDDQCVKMEYVMMAMEEAGNSLNIFILDACRNNPFRSFSRSSERGLGQVSAPTGSYVVYATAANSVASDGTGENGLFTSKLLKYINTPDLNIEQVFKLVARDVASESGGAQVPWLSSSYFGDFYFSGSPNEKAGTRNEQPRSFKKLTPAEQKELLKKTEDVKLRTERFSNYMLLALNGNPEGQHLLAHAYRYGNGVRKDTIEANIWYAKALVGLRALANSGDVNAQYLLGRSYENGWGVPRNSAEAKVWMKKAAEKNNVDAIVTLSYDKDDTEAAKWLLKGLESGEKSVMDAFMNRSVSETKGPYQEPLQLLARKAEAGDAFAQYTLGMVYHRGKLVGRDFELAVGLLQKAADQGLMEAMANLGGCYLRGEGVSKDNNKAISWYKKAAEQGDSRAMSALARLCDSDAVKDEKQAYEWYRKLAENVSSIYYDVVGDRYRNGWGVPKDFHEAVLWYKKGADQFHGDALNKLARMYENGQGVTMDVNEALRLYQLAADQGHLDAMVNVGWMYENGSGTPSNYQQAVSWYRRAADRGSLRGMCNLGICYENGIGVTKDVSQANTLYRTAADKGFARAQYCLGLNYYNGTGLPKDIVQANDWFQKAANQEYSEAQAALGHLYNEKKEYKTAFEWYKKAADQGHTQGLTMMAAYYYDGTAPGDQNYSLAFELAGKAAQGGNANAFWLLGLMYENGNGVTKNLVEAIKWYDKAAAGGNEAAKESLRRLSK